VIKFVSDLRQVSGFLCRLHLRFGLDWFHCTKICGFIQITGIIGVRVMVFNATFNNFIGGGNWSTRSEFTISQTIEFSASVNLNLNNDNNNNYYYYYLI
jgi:hypothetical protein